MLLLVNGQNTQNKDVNQRYNLFEKMISMTNRSRTARRYVNARSTKEKRTLAAVATTITNIQNRRLPVYT